MTNIYINIQPPKDCLHVLFAQGITKFNPFKTPIRLWGKVATLKNFTKQFSKFENICFHGGDTPTLLSYLRRDLGWMTLLERKNIYAYSAGVSALAMYSFNIDHNIIIRGLGIIPYQTIVHYTDRKYDMLVKLHLENPHMEIFVVRDEEQTIIRMENGDIVELKAVEESGEE